MLPSRSLVPSVTIHRRQDTTRGTSKRTQSNFVTFPCPRVLIRLCTLHTGVQPVPFFPAQVRHCCKLSRKECRYTCFFFEMPPEIRYFCFQVATFRGHRLLIRTCSERQCSAMFLRKMGPSACLPQGGTGQGSLVVSHEP